MITLHLLMNSFTLKRYFHHCQYDLKNSIRTQRNTWCDLLLSLYELLWVHIIFILRCDHPSSWREGQSCTRLAIVRGALRQPCDLHQAGYSCGKAVTAVHRCTRVLLIWRELCSLWATALRGQDHSANKWLPCFSPNQSNFRCHTLSFTFTSWEGDCAFPLWWLPPHAAGYHTYTTQSSGGKTRDCWSWCKSLSHLRMCFSWFHREKSQIQCFFPRDDE